MLCCRICPDLAWGDQAHQDHQDHAWSYQDHQDQPGDGGDIKKSVRVSLLARI
jgi:hypothetical protein